jgi:hypothetical protein
MDPAPLQIVIDVEAGAVPISGQVRVEGDAPRPFTGWTGLFAALRAMAGEDQPR